MSYNPDAKPPHSDPFSTSHSILDPPAYDTGDGAFVQQPTTTVTNTTSTSFFSNLRIKANKQTQNPEGGPTPAEKRPEREEMSNNLLIHKDLPQLPEHRIGIPIRKGGRPRTADDAREAERRGSAVGVTMPLALAHAAMGLRIPTVPPVSPGWSLDQLSGSEDSVERYSSAATTRSPAQEASLAAKRRSSLSLGRDVNSTLAVDQSAEFAAPGASVLQSGKPTDRSSTSVWISLPSLNHHIAPKKSKTMQNGVSGVEIGTPGKQITRRASWWLRRKAESPIHSPSSSFASPFHQDFGRGVTSIDSPIVDLSHSPPDAPFTSYGATSPLEPLVATTTEDVEGLPGQDQPAPLQDSSDKSSSKASSSRRPRSISLFLKPTPAFPSDVHHISNGQQSPTSPGAHSRPRTGQTPPLIRRISTNFFSHSPYSSTSPTPQSSLSISAALPTKPSLEQIPKVIPRPKVDEETPEAYVQRLLESVTKAEVAVVLASSGDDFYSKALKAYLEKFSFKGDPLDIAVRRLLMDLALPKETQQIDRVMEAFSARYTECNPGLFAEPDQAYILAFSLIMLHTDAFNKSNKNKMTKASYIKNTRLPGVYPEVLDYFFDNIVFAPFIFIEDPLDANGQRAFRVDSASSVSSFMSRNNRIDPYYLITSGQLDHLRLGVENFIPRKTPYKYLGTAAAWDHEELRQAFAEASVVELGDKEAARRQAAVAIMASAGFTSTGPAVLPLSFSGHSGVAPSAFNDVWTFKLTKIGVINRKEDVLEGGKKSTARKWRQYKVALTGSQLLFFKDLRWDHHLAEKAGGGRVLTLPHPSMVKPDEVISVNDAIAVLDTSYTKYRNAFRLALPKGREYLMQVLDEHELNEWIARINYASAFRTAGLRMRASGLSGRDVELTGIAAANSHVRDTVFWQQQIGSPAAVHNWISSDGNVTMASLVDTDTDEEPSFATSPLSGPRPKRLLPVSRSTAQVDLESPESSVHEEAEQMKAAFEDVKAELAANLPLLTDPPEEGLSRKNTNRSYRSNSAEKLSSPQRTSHDTDTSRERVSSRGNALKLKVEELEKKIVASCQQLESDLRYARNLSLLAPFQQATRNRLHEQVLNLARRVAQERLELTKLRCHREVLHNDFVSEERQRYQTTRAALKVATATLKTRLRDAPSKRTGSLDETKVASLPRQTATAEQLRQNSFASSSSSNQGSGPTIDALSPLEGLELTPKRRGNRGLPSVDLGAGLQEQQIPGSDEPLSAIDASFQDTKKRSAEQAEEWNKTRAAKRVSLVTLRPESLKPFSARAQPDEALGPLNEAANGH